MSCQAHPKGVHECGFGCGTEWRDPKWTTEPPTEPGIYWARFTDSDLPPRVVEHEGGSLVGAMGGETFEISVFDLWCGPINPPKVPK